jgi:NAD(P)-dependent dehydrogenase (short-subunit alcohol dehydrogenase family)
VATKQVVLITGCSTGFGRVAAETLARKGYPVFAAIRDIESRNVEKANELRYLAHSESLPLSVVDLDVTDDDSVGRAVEQVVYEAGRIDVLVNNAGISLRGLIEGVTIEQTRRLFETNVVAVQRMNRAVLPHMRRRGTGLLIHISSQVGRLTIPGIGMYGASKFALEALAEAYHYELAGEGIDSVLIEPGAYATAIGQNAQDSADVSRAAAYGPARQIPQQLMAALGKRGDPQEIADVILRLIEMPAGARPLRTAVGVPGNFLEDLNRATEQPQAGIVQALGLAPLTAFRPRPGGNHGQGK